jgi:hypothetical protein
LSFLGLAEELGNAPQCTADALGLFCLGIYASSCRGEVDRGLEAHRWKREFCESTSLHLPGKEGAAFQTIKCGESSQLCHVNAYLSVRTMGLLLPLSINCIEPRGG